ncbi:tRNA pseudouridine(54/55) synthase Pus10 [Candidatus Thorarchaeota archaeon]|nr:MAG: tRNA pseudouridine(54/55) synthase Pus10 [Candidatus Thorarchaeota archaeon]
MEMNTSNNVLEKAVELLTLHPVCNQCLGRQFAWLSTDSTNEERGRSIKLLLSMTADERVRTGEAKIQDTLMPRLANHGMYGPAISLCEEHGIDVDVSRNCYLCEVRNKSIFKQIPNIARRVLERVISYEFDTFLIGCVPNPTVSERQDELRAKLNLLHAEALKSDFNRELGKHLENLLEKKVEFENPDIVIIYEMTGDTFRLQVNPIFIYGRYRKLERGIPQSRWDCSSCNGKGCEECNETGRRYPDSVSEYVSKPILKVAQGSKFKFHAAGREDVDALMLGSGRPFVVEISEPKKRRINLDEIESAINSRARGKVEVDSLEFTSREVMQNLKSDASSNIKEYVAKIATEEEVSNDKLRRAETELRDIEIEQRTPHRVAHRRSDRIRKKRVHSVKLLKTDEHELRGDFVVQGGTYVKELISGDEGRTTPSLSSLLGTKCTCLKLNVTAIRA